MMPHSFRVLKISLVALIISGVILSLLEPYEPYFSIIGSIYVLIILFYSIKGIRHIAEYQKQQRLARLQLLQSQVMPHFLFNTLNLIYGNLDSDPEKSKETILHLSELLRVGLYEARNRKYLLTKEISFIENYIKIYQHRYPDMKPIKFNCDIDNDQVLIVPLILFPLVENAFKHGLEMDVLNTAISIGILVKKNKLLFKISNNYRPYSQYHEAGIGLSNLKERLNIVYKDNFKINTKKDTFKFEITLNLVL